jgi:hypothetical protein
MARKRKKDEKESDAALEAEWRATTWDQLADLVGADTAKAMRERARIRREARAPYNDLMFEQYVGELVRIAREMMVERMEAAKSEPTDATPSGTDLQDR